MTPVDLIKRGIRYIARRCGAPDAFRHARGGELPARRRDGEVPFVIHRGQDPFNAAIRQALADDRSRLTRALRKGTR